MVIEIINHLDITYSINYKKSLPISPEDIEIIKKRTGSSVVLQRQTHLFFAEEIADVNFEEINPPKKIIPETQIVKFTGPKKTVTKKTVTKKKKNKKNKKNKIKKK